MPVYRDPFTKGDLVVQFTVKFPENNWIDPAVLPELEQFLPARQECIVPGDAEEAVLTEFDPAQSRNRRRDMYDSDDEDGHPGASRVQCASH